MNDAVEEIQTTIGTKVKTISFDGIMPWEDVKSVVGLSRPTVWRMEREGKFPKRVQISPGRVGWVGQEIKAHNESLPRVQTKKPKRSAMGTIES